MGASITSLDEFRQTKLKSSNGLLDTKIEEAESRASAGKSSARFRTFVCEGFFKMDLKRGIGHLEEAAACFFIRLMPSASHIALACASDAALPLIPIAGLIM